MRKIKKELYSYKKIQARNRCLLQGAPRARDGSGSPQEQVPHTAAWAAEAATVGADPARPVRCGHGSEDYKRTAR